MKPHYPNNLEDGRLFHRLLAKLREDYPPTTVQHDADLNNLARLNWQSERLAHLIEADLNLRLDHPLVRPIQDPATRLLRAHRRAASHRGHQFLVRQSEANLRAIHSLAARVEKWAAAK